MKTQFVLWKCGNCKSRHRTQVGYWIRCSCGESKDYKVLEVYEEEVEK